MVKTNVDDIIKDLEGTRNISVVNPDNIKNWTKRCTQLDDIISHGKLKDLKKYLENNLNYQHKREVNFDKKDWSNGLSEDTKKDIISLRKRLLNVFLGNVYTNTDRLGNILYGFPVDIQYSRASYNNGKKEHKDEIVAEECNIKIYFHTKVVLFDPENYKILGETTWSIRKIKKLENNEEFLQKIFK